MDLFRFDFFCREDCEVALIASVAGRFYGLNQAHNNQHHQHHHLCILLIADHV